MKHILLTLGITLFCSLTHAEQALPITIVEDDILYRSQLNYVEAINNKSKKTLWETEVYQDIEPKTYIPGLEQDVQWNVIIKLNIEGMLIRVIDSNNKVYLLYKVSGKIKNQ